MNTHSLERREPLHDGSAVLGHPLYPGGQIEQLHSSARVRPFQVFEPEFGREQLQLPPQRSRGLNRGSYPNDVGEWKRFECQLGVARRYLNAIVFLKFNYRRVGRRSIIKALGCGELLCSGPDLGGIHQNNCAIADKAIDPIFSILLGEPSALGDITIYCNDRCCRRQHREHSADSRARETEPVSCISSGQYTFSCRDNGRTKNHPEEDAGDADGKRVPEASFHASTLIKRPLFVERALS
ncbi:hypothetical protein Snov_0006 [Ancylobacter novellus DSM 506]|uniref:Uncharacterized protein n=1 Tax=Ancylobacter novellus (strain ATCC 8093 / DSM 506 / JCM 20403 / CCM 1077 / IAM 12100 / NBRC 12443 / NCIMB 10456) TaxID=639283 RepID=D6ZZS9_ANCN5|nr:hypothetical protein Snov_0006 [Ancylobacter novellus DSM 506]